MTQNVSLPERLEATFLTSAPDLRRCPPIVSAEVAFAGRSNAGKSSVLNRLLGRAKVLTDAETERTIGLEIARVVLPDPQGRAPGGVVLVVYDAGGHDEYQEMQQVFVTPNTLYLLLWDLAKRPAEGQDAQAFRREKVAQQVQWAQLIQSCAPGSTVRQLGAPSLLFLLPCFLASQSLGRASPVCCGFLLRLLLLLLLL